MTKAIMLRRLDFAGSLAITEARRWVDRFIFILIVVQQLWEQQ